MNKILLIEDNEGDILLTSIILKDIDSSIDLDIARDGEEAIRKIDKIKSDLYNNRPKLILLDVNLPKKNGFEVLNYIRSCELLDSIPVVMLTTSSFPKDRLMALENNASDFLTKSSDLTSFQATIKEIHIKWMETSALYNLAS